jgi:predicted phage baseplate assembly protein
MKGTTSVQSCGCCEGIEKLTPMPTANRPGLEALAYRVGTHASFLETMKARLSNLYLEIPSEGDGQGKQKIYPLRALTTRDGGDPSIALLDAWATVADVLTFYQERVANEGYLRTATERRSILELARLVGYKLHPGVAASVYLAFELENGYQVEIPPGTRAQSLPGPGELPQPFETSEPLPARTAWNQLKPRMTRPQRITLYPFPDPDAGATKIKTVYFEGTATNLNADDPLLFAFGTGTDQQVLRRVESVEPQAAENRTKVVLQDFAKSLKAGVAAAMEPFVAAVQDVAEKYLDLEAFDISPDTQMAQRVVAIVKDLRASLTRDVAPEEATARLDEALTALRAQHTIAVGRGFTKLEPWVGGLVARLEATQGDLAAVSFATAEVTATETTDTADISDEGPTDERPRTAFGKLGALLKPLAKAPSPPPPNALRLERDIKATFAPGADMVPRLLTTLQPALRPVLYQAWANLIVGAPAGMEVHALRLTAAPFGHNAPLRPDHYNKDRKLVINDEWRIYDPWNQDPPSADFIACPPGGEAPLTVQFADRSTGYVKEWKWTFGDQSESSKQDPQHTFKAAGVYTVTLTVRSPSGVDTAEKSITVTEAGAISANFITDPSSGRSPLTVQFTDTSSGEIDQWMWDFGDGGSSSVQNPSHTFSNPTEVTETFFVKLEVSGPVGTSTAIKPIIVLPPVNLIVGPSATLPLAAAPAPGPLPPHHGPNYLYLDAEYEILPGSWVVIEKADETKYVMLKEGDVSQQSLAAYGLSGKATALRLEEPWIDTGEPFSTVRTTRVHAQSEQLTLAEWPIEEPIGHDEDGKHIELDGLYDGLESGRWLIVTGERADVKDEAGNIVPGVPAAELVMLAGVEQGSDKYAPEDKPHTTLILEKSLAYAYQRDTASIYANVIKATHGETRQEVLGSGDGSTARQRFTLKQSPLTYTAAPTPAGAESTLEVYVNDVRWHEAESLVDLSRTDRKYTTETDNEGKTTAVFGDGQRGARLPTGSENIRAKYRSGIGKPGNVAAEQISMLATRPLGVKGVINPRPASGGADPESRDQARSNAPLAVMALDRLVSVQDYADFARTFAGIGKASAVHLTDGQRQLVHVTIAGADDIPIDEESDLYRNLVMALRQHGDPHQPIEVEMRELMVLIISARVRLLPDYQWESVAPQIRNALLEAFGFERRELGQDVLQSEVISVIQRVPGVAYVDLDVLNSVSEAETKDATLLDKKLKELTGEEANGTTKGPRPRIPVRMAGPGDGNGIAPAQLAILSPDLPDTLILTEIS